MRTIIYILQKEFIQIFRNRTMLPFIFLVPVVQLVVLVYAATLDMKDIDMCVVDKDMSSTSRQLVNKIKGSPFYTVNQSSFSAEKAKTGLYKGSADIILHIPAGFEEKLVRYGKVKLQLLINAINSTSASLIHAYTKAVIADFNKQITYELVSYQQKAPSALIEIIPSYWYNQTLNYKFYMVPGILVILITIIGMFLTALNIVREKEIGTIEQINVTPIRKHHFLIGKLLPFLFIALFDLGLGLIIGKILFDIPLVGSLGLLFGFATIYLFAALGIGLFFSTLANTQQQLMFIVFFFMLTFVLMSGVFTPTESMPVWAQRINIINPFAYFMRAMRMILLKGSGFMGIFEEFISLVLYGIIIFGLAIVRFRKTA